MKILNNPTKWLLSLSLSLFIFNSCQKDIENKGGSLQSSAAKIHGHLKQTKTYSAEAAIKWMEMQLRLLRTNATPVGGLQPGRYFGYCGIALYESVVPGMPSYQTLSGQLTDMPFMPATLNGVAYHWPTCANAALASMNRNFFPNTSAENKASVDSLENALNASYSADVNAEEFLRSVEYGKAVAQLIFDWSKTDGSATVYPPYVPPVGPGLWVPTPPAFAPAIAPYWGNNRLVVPGSLNGSVPPPPPSYSTNPSSDYYKMVKEVYDISQSLTSEQIAIGLYYRDNPGYGGGHYLSIFKQVLQQEDPKLDFAALAYAKVGIACIDAAIGNWKAKYTYNVERPITYIRDVLDNTTWSPLFPTPAFPEYPSGHSTVAGSFTTLMTNLFGANYQFTNHTYDYLGMAPRSFNSFDELAIEIGASRVYAGIHYTIACVNGRQQGIKIAQNILSTVKFKK